MPDPWPDEPDLSTHPLVAKLHRDPDSPPRLVALTGYFGPSRKADSIRLYPGLDFHSYLEIPRESIVATAAVNADDEQSPTLVHVKAGTLVEAVHTSTRPVESYLQGGITGEHIQGASTAEFAGGGIHILASICGICPSHHIKNDFPIPATYHPWRCRTVITLCCIAFASKCPQICPSHNPV